jgi:glycosyltransferase involved in cell wall biosynthesis
MYDHPALRPDLMDDVRFRLYLVTCEWMRDLFRPVYGDRVALWYGGIDLDSWPDASGDKKQYDVLVYDKIRWDRDRLVPDVLDRVVAALERRGLSYHVLRYGRYNVRTYRRLLSASRAMVFLCEHETQGLAYQEAMASNLPILAWDPGRWVDPRAPKLEPSIVPTTSVPHFSPACGERFVQAADFEGALDHFWDRLPLYRPRRYVEQNLSVSGSAELYMRYYRSLMPASTSSADLKPAV